MAISKSNQALTDNTSMGKNIFWNEHSELY